MITLSKLITELFSASFLIVTFIAVMQEKKKKQHLTVINQPRICKLKSVYVKFCPNYSLTEELYN